MFEDALYSYLANYPTLTAAIGTRVYPAHLPQEVFTNLDSTQGALTYQQISGQEDHTHSGRGGSERARYQITIFCARHCDAQKIALKVNAALDAYRGWMGDQENGVQVGRIARQNRIDLGRDPGARLYKVALDFMVWYVPRE